MSDLERRLKQAQDAVMKHNQLAAQAEGQRKALEQQRDDVLAKIKAEGCETVAALETEIARLSEEVAADVLDIEQKVSQL